MSTITPPAEQTDTARWVKQGLYGGRKYNWPQCTYCGCAQERDCERVVCALCGTPQCHKNGLGNGTCAVCTYGWLPGWSRWDGTDCGYKGCQEPGVAYAPRVKRVCAEHVERAKVRVTGRWLTLAEHVAERVAHRDSGKGWERWKLVA